MKESVRTQQAKGGVRCCYYDKTYVGARLKLYVQQTLELSYTGRESHTMAPAVCHTVPSCRRTCWVRTPSASHRYVFTHLRWRLPINVHIRATSEGASYKELWVDWCVKLAELSWPSRPRAHSRRGRGRQRGKHESPRRINQPRQVHRTPQCLG